MKNFIFLSLLFIASVAWGQDSKEPSGTFKTLTQVNDSTWMIETFNEYEYSFFLGEVEYPKTYTVPIPEETIYVDSTSAINYLYTVVYNEQQRQAQIISLAFDMMSYQRNIMDASNQIDSITGGTSSYYEESAKRTQNLMVGDYRLQYDSAGVSMNVIGTVSLLTNQEHPDGRALRLTLPNGEDYIMRVFSRWNFMLVNWPYSNERFNSHKSRSSDKRTVYRPLNFIEREDTTTRIIKLF